MYDTGLERMRAEAADNQPFLSAARGLPRLSASDWEFAGTRSRPPFLDDASYDAFADPADLSEDPDDKERSGEWVGGWGSAAPAPGRPLAGPR